MNRLVNPFVRRILRSPLHDLLGGGIVLVRVRGRRTGKIRTVPANGVPDGAGIVLTSLKRRAWWRNLEGGAAVAVTIAGTERQGWGEVVDAGPEQLSEAVARAYERAGHPIAPERARALAADRVLVRIELQPPETAAMPLRGRPLWRQWTRTVTLGEIAAFAIPAAAGALLVTSELSPAATVPIVLAAGLGEGAVLGLAQAYVVRQALPSISSRRWIAATALGAMIAWAVSLVPTSIGEDLDQLGVGWLLAGGALLGVVFLGALGGLQWRLLREHVEGAAWWVVAVGGAWVAALSAFMAIAGPLWREGQAVWQTAAVGLVATVAMAGVMAVITGYALMRLTDQPNVSRGLSRYRAPSTDPG